MGINSDKKKVIAFLLKPFPLLDDFKSKLFLVFFCGIFSTFFISFFNPFNIKQITYESSLGNFLSISSVGIVGAIILSFSQFYLRKKANLNQFNLGQFLLWSVFEMIFICIGIFILFGESNEPFLQEFLLIINYTISLAILPYVIACLLISVTKLSAKVREGEKLKTNSPKQHLFKNEKGKVMLAIKLNQILFLKSENNYTSIYYLQNEKVKKKLIRTSLKKLEEELQVAFLMRIHRSYMVNLNQVVGVQREKGSFQIQVNQLPDLSLKVSESYRNSFEVRMEG